MIAKGTVSLKYRTRIFDIERNSLLIKKVKFNAEMTFSANLHVHYINITFHTINIEMSKFTMII